MKKSLSIEEFLETRPDITPEMLEEGRLLVEAKIKGYELQQARKAYCVQQALTVPGGPNPYWLKMLKSL